MTPNSKKFDRIRLAILRYETFQRENYATPDGKTWWDHHNVQRRIASAACNYHGYIVTGVRHHCMIMRMQIDASGGKALLDEWVSVNSGVKQQGFVDQFGNFLTRTEAWPIAVAANQLIRHDITPGKLYSENIV